MKSVLLTRSLEDNNEIINQISQHININKFNYIHSPLLEYAKLNFNGQILNNYSDIIITSKFAAQILISWFEIYNKFQIDSLIKRNIWVVGKSIEEILDPAKFAIQKVAGNIEELMKNFPANLYSKTIYLSSNHITQELPPEIKRQVIYHVNYAKTLPCMEIHQNKIDYILLYSQNTAKTLIDLCIKNKLLKLLKNASAITISLKVANIIRPFVKQVIYSHEEKSNQIVKLLLDDAQYRN